MFEPELGEEDGTREGVVLGTAVGPVVGDPLGIKPPVPSSNSSAERRSVRETQLRVGNSNILQMGVAGVGDLCKKRRRMRELTLFFAKANIP